MSLGEHHAFLPEPSAAPPLYAHAPSCPCKLPACGVLHGHVLRWAHRLCHLPAWRRRPCGLGPCRARQRHARGGGRPCGRGHRPRWAAPHACGLACGLCAYRCLCPAHAAKLSHARRCLGTRGPGRWLLRHRRERLPALPHRPSARAQTHEQSPRRSSWARSLAVP